MLCGGTMNLFIWVCTGCCLKVKQHVVECCGFHSETVLVERIYTLGFPCFG